MKQRIITALLLAPLAIAAVLFLPSAAFMALAAALLLVGLWEWTRLIGFEGHARRSLILFAHAGAMAWLAWRGWPALFPLVALLGVAWWFASLVWLRYSQFARAPTTAHRWTKLLVGSLLIVPTWCAIGMLHYDGAYGPRWAFYSLALVWAADSFAYFTGRHFGGAKLSPTISPNKTWAGFWGGLVGVVLLSLAAVPLLGLAWSAWPALVAVTLLAALASVIGDLFESLIKRHAGAKDSSQLIPGHGGVLDRIDSVVAAVPVFAVAKAVFGL